MGSRGGQGLWEQPEALQAVERALEGLQLDAAQQALVVGEGITLQRLCAPLRAVSVLQAMTRLLETFRRSAPALANELVSIPPAICAAPVGMCQCGKVSHALDRHAVRIMKRVTASIASPDRVEDIWPIEDPIDVCETASQTR